MKQMKFLIVVVAAASAAFADSSVTWTTDQTGGLVLDGNVTITVPSGTSVTCSGVISGSGKLIKEGAGSLTLSADNTYSGGTQVNAGKLIGTSDNPFGNDHANNPIYVNTNLTDGRNTSTDTSTAIIFSKAGTSASAPQTYGYPITCSAWSNHGARPGSYNNVGRGSSTLYNIALGADYIKLTGDITGGDISIRCGTIGSGWGANPALKRSPAISGNITALGGTLALSSRAQEFALSGIVKVGAIYHPIAQDYPTTTKLSNAGNEIGWFDCGRRNSGGEVTASAAGVMGGAVLISTSADFTKTGGSDGGQSISQSFKLGNYNQTINYPTIDYFRPRTPSDSVGMLNTIHCITCGKTLTMAATATATNDWCFSSDASAASLVWNPQGDFWLHNVSRAHLIGGSITVNRGGFSMDENCSFSNVTAITVGNGASFVNESTVEKSLKSVSAITLGADATLSLSNNPFAGSVTMEAGAGTTLNLAENITVVSCKVGDHYLSAKDYSAGTHKDLTISGAGKFYVQTCPGATYTWIGGGDDNNISTPGNWQNSTAPDFGSESPNIVFAGGTAAVLDRDVSASGITFDGVSSFELSAQDGYTLSLGAGGISNAPAASASAVTVSAPVMPMIDQVWQMDTNVTFTLSGILKQYGTTTPTITFRQSSFADPAITFIGASTAEGASDFAGDIVFEETPLGNNKYGVAYVRASGYDPFGPGGTLMLNSLGEGHYNNNHGRLATFYLSNAVISKTFKFGPYYNAYIVADDNTTNIFTGAFIPTKLNKSNGTFPPQFKVGTNSVLRLCGDMDFGTRNNSDTANLILGSTAGKVADAPTGTIAFDGRITRLPRRLELGNPIRLELNASENTITNLYLRHGKNATAVVSFGDSYALSNGQAVVTFPNYNSSPVDFDLNGTTQHIARFVARSNGAAPESSRISSSNAPGVLRISQSSDVNFEGYVATNVTIQMEGTATLTFTHATAFKAGSTLAVSNGTVAVSNASALNADVTLKLLGGTISIPAGQTAQDGEAFYLDGNGKLIPLCNGTYGPGDRTIGSFFAPGSGSIRVRKGMSKGLVIIFN